MVVTCLIEFEKNPEGTYFAGDVVHGKITLTADKVKKVKGILSFVSLNWKIFW